MTTSLKHTAALSALTALRADGDALLYAKTGTVALDDAARNALETAQKLVAALEALVEESDLALRESEGETALETLQSLLRAAGLDVEITEATDVLVVVVDGQNKHIVSYDERGYHIDGGPSFDDADKCADALVEFEVDFNS